MTILKHFSEIPFREQRNEICKLLDLDLVKVFYISFQYVWLFLSGHYMNKPISNFDGLNCFEINPLESLTIKIKVQSRSNISIPFHGNQKEEP